MLLTFLATMTLSAAIPQAAERTVPQAAERTVPQAALNAQREALTAMRKGLAGDAAALLAADSVPERAAAAPPRFATGASMEVADRAGATRYRYTPRLEVAIGHAIAGAAEDGAFAPNQPQLDAISWALGRRLSLVRGPPGTGKTRTAALLIASALRLHEPPRLDGAGVAPPPRVLAVAHSNGAADVLLAALLRAGVPAVRAGRPAAVSPAVRRRPAVALAEQSEPVRALPRLLIIW